MFTGLIHNLRTARPSDCSYPVASGTSGADASPDVPGPVGRRGACDRTAAVPAAMRSTDRPHRRRFASAARDSGGDHRARRWGAAVSRRTHQSSPGKNCPESGRIGTIGARRFGSAGHIAASLLARLDRLGPTAREVAQAGAAIGRAFSYDLLRSIVGLPEPALSEALAQLASSGLVHVRGTSTEATYTFKHALVHDVANGLLLRGRRRMLHARIVENLWGRDDEPPEVLAWHCTMAGFADQAIKQWRLAGEKEARPASQTSKPRNTISRRWNSCNHCQRRGNGTAARASCASLNLCRSLLFTVSVRKPSKPAHFAPGNSVRVLTRWVGSWPIVSCGTRP